MHTVFRVIEIKPLRRDTSIFKVNLQLTADDDQDLRILTQHMRKEVHGETGWERLGLLLVKIGHFDKAEELYNELLNQSFDRHKEAIYYNSLGNIKHQQGDHKKAIDCYEKALRIFQTTLPVNHPTLARSYSNIAAVYYNTGEYSKALSFSKKALEIDQKAYPTNHHSLAASYNNIAVVYRKMAKYPKALSLYEKALEILQKVLPANHPHFAASNGNIAAEYLHIGEYSKALSFYEKALEILQKTLPPNHPDLATSYSNIAAVYQTWESTQKHFRFTKTHLKFDKKLFLQIILLATSYNNIAAVYEQHGRVLKALSFYEKALEILQKTLPPNHPDLATSYNNIAMVYQTWESTQKHFRFTKTHLKCDKKLFLQIILIWLLPTTTSLCVLQHGSVSKALSYGRVFSKALSTCSVRKEYSKALEITRNATKNSSSKSS